MTCSVTWSMLDPVLDAPLIIRGVVGKRAMSVQVDGGRHRLQNVGCGEEGVGPVQGAGSRLQGRGQGGGGDCPHTCGRKATSANCGAVGRSPAKCFHIHSDTPPHKKMWFRDAPLLSGLLTPSTDQRAIILTKQSTDQPTDRSTE